jgi:hypothetical protein
MSFFGLRLLSKYLAANKIQDEAVAEAASSAAATAKAILQQKNHLKTARKHKKHVENKI